MTNETTNFSTSDVCLAAYLLKRNYKIVDITRDGQRGTFHFADVPKMELITYDTGTASVEPTTFHAAVRQLTAAVKRSIA